MMEVVERTEEQKQEQLAKNIIHQREFKAFLDKRDLSSPWEMSITTDGSVAIHQVYDGDKSRLGPALFVLQKIGVDGWGCCYDFTDEEMADFGRRIVSAVNAQELA